MPAIQLNVALGEILADNSNQLDRGKKAGRNGGVTGRAAEQSRIFSFGRFYGIKGGGANDKHAHGSLISIISRNWQSVS